MRKIVFIFLLSIIYTSMATSASYIFYKNGEASAFDDIETADTIAGWDSLSIVGDLDDWSGWEYLKPSIKSIQLLDFSKAEFTQREYWLFVASPNLENLKTVRFPTDTINARIKLDFTGCKNLTTIENLEMLQNVSLTYSFEQCESLKKIHFGKCYLVGGGGLDYSFKDCKNLEEFEANVLDVQDKNKLFLLHNGFFGGCEKLQMIYIGEVRNGNLTTSFRSCKQIKTIRIDKITNSRLSKTFAESETLEDIYIGSISDSEYDNDNAFDGCNAQVHFSRENNYFCDAWKKNFRIFLWHIDSSSVHASVQNGQIKILNAIAYPQCMIAQDTIWKVGETFEAAEIIESTDSLNKITNFENKNIWVGLKNESMDDYVWSAPFHLQQEKDAMAYIVDANGEYYIKLDTINNLKVVKPQTIRIVGTMDDNLLRKAKNHFHSNAGWYQNIDLSEASFAFSNENLDSIAFGMGNIQHFAFPEKDQEGTYDLTSSFEGCLSLREIKNLENIHDIGGLEQAFVKCESLKELTFSQEADTNKISLKKTFEGCWRLERINNLDRFKNITNISYTFNGCKALQTVAFSSEEKADEIRLEHTFYQCNNLKSISGLESFINYQWANFAFVNCYSLDTLRLGHPKDNYISGNRAFENCHAFIYFPKSMTTYDESRVTSIILHNVVLPIVDFYADINSIDSISIIPQPQYVAIQDTLWKYKIEDSIHSSKELTAEIKANASMIWCGIKNDAMSEYIWSLPIYTKKPDMPYLSLGISPQSYKMEEMYHHIVTIDSLYPGSIHKYASNYKYCSIQLYGNYNDSNIIRVKNAMRENNSALDNLTSFDFSNATLNITNGLKGFFQGTTKLGQVIFPQERNESPVNLDSTFYGSGIYEVNLSYFENITCMDFAFTSSSLKKVTFSEKENNNEVSFIQTFLGCPIDSIDLSSFSKISCLTQTFFSAGAFDHIHFMKFSDKENSLPVSMFQTFAGMECNMDEIINLDKFTNVNNYIATFQSINNFRNTRLDTVRLGTDPNTIAPDSLTWTFAMSGKVIKYLPDGVDTIPEKWCKYHNFVVPITVDSSNWSIDSLFKNSQSFSDFIYSLPDLGPSYAYIADTTWYLVLNDYLQTWINSFGFSSSLRAASAEQPISTEKYMVFDPQAMDIADYMEDYSLVCVASNPKHKALAYQVKLKDLLEIVQVPEVITDTDCKIYTDQGTIVVSASIDSDVEIYDTTGKLIHIGHIGNDKELKVNVPNGVYLVKCGKHSRGKVTVKNSKE